LALSEHALHRAPSRSSASPVNHARGLRRRLALALVAGSAIAAFGVAPVTEADWPVASRASHITQWAHRGHVALDIGAHAWTRIIPMRAGRVVFAGWRRNCGGWQVWVYHGRNLYSAYYHMSRVAVHRGQRVTARRTIGYIGSTGCATGPHVHMEVWRGRPWRHGSRRVNPWVYVDSGRWLPRRYR
jgi:murein DD-endopeptidase MepM/ murein hydrolase activator NlpD